MREDDPQYRSGPGFITCNKHSPGIDFFGFCPYCFDEKKRLDAQRKTKADDSTAADAAKGETP